MAYQGFFFFINYYSNPKPYSKSLVKTLLIHNNTKPDPVSSYCIIMILIHSKCKVKNKTSVFQLVGNKYQQ